MKKVKRYHKIIAFFFAINIFQCVLPYNLLFASNNGPNAPEASGFESVNATDMVNLASGDMSYVLPLMDVGGLPISLSYHGGVPLDLESTWTGLGWNLNTGAINRGLNATPDDWNGGQSLDFIRYSKAEETYSVNVGVGLSTAAEVGIGASWGSNKALSGSVFASIGLGKDGSGLGASGSLDTNGNYSVGISAGTGESGEQSFGGGVGISGNVNSSKINVSVGAGLRTENGMTMGVGTSLDGGLSVSVGYSETSGTGGGMKGAGGSGSLSTASFSAGDWEISSKGWYIPIQIHFVSFGFGKQKVTYKLKKGYKKLGYGILYNNNLFNSTDAIESDTNADGIYSDYQNRYRYADAYEQSLPIPEKEFVADYDNEREKLNFTYSAYDSYDVNATGISGVMQPKILQNATVFGLGYSGNDPNNTQGSSENPGKMRTYWHNTNTTSKRIANSSALERINFYFNGQFTQNVNANGYLSTTSSTLANPLTPQNNDFNSLQGILTSRGATQNPRLKQGNFTEVFTNLQIKNNQANGLLSPLNPTGNGTNLEALNRNNSPEYKNDGIGGYKITAPDGKVYHFSQPVYHYEMVERNVLEDNSEKNVSEKRQYTSYATHWLLTAITGPDFIDTNNNNIADAQDYGYWVRMDYGKWSDGYVWRNPTDKSLKDYSTNIEGNIGKKDFGTYQFGRKQLYYLDKVVSSTHTAYFVKNLRYDSVGSDLRYKFEEDPNFNTISLDGTVINNQAITNNGTNTVTGSNPAINPLEDFTYKKQMQLMLEKIVLVKNSDATVSKGNSTSPLQLNTQSVSDYVKNYTLPINPAGGFFEVYNEAGQQPSILINNESGVYDVKDFENFDYNNAVKVINLEYNYNLAVKDHTNINNDINKSNGSPGTIQCAVNPNAGKLCLKRVRFLGRNNFDFMPPYEFEYNGEYKGASLPYIKYPANAIVKKTSFTGFLLNWKGNTMQTVENISSGVSVTETPIADARAKDEWGFLKDNEGQSDIAAAAWTMNQIKTPTGATIDFEHEEDDFHTEAFSRRYWTSGLEFYFDNLTNSQTLLGHQFPSNTSTIDLHIKKNQQENLLPSIDFTRYFDANSIAFLDFFICVTDRDAASSSDWEDIDIPGQGMTPILVDSNQVVFRFNVNQFSNHFDDSTDFLPYTFSLGRNLGWGNFDGEQRSCSSSSAGDGFTLKYKLLANKVPKDETGGGLRVKSITLKDEIGSRYKTAYYYNKPGTNRVKDVGTYKSSGITSYSPVRGQKFVPYQSELPSPGVMYEYVTMRAEDQNGNDLGETRYHFYTLQPVLDIFNEEIEMKDSDNTTIFKANVIDHNTESTLVIDHYATVLGQEPIPVYRTENYLNPTKKIKSKSIKLDVNTSHIGQIKSIENYNKAGQLMSKTMKNYLSGYALKTANLNRGSVTESFQSMKSVFTSNSSDGNLTLKNRFLSVSTKEDFSSVLQSIVTTGMHGKTTETYSNTDPETGAFMVVETQKSDGTKKRVERVPAYRKYSELGSKTVNINNKHMLTQETMNVTSYLKDNMWKSVDASITSWKKEWNYRDNLGIEDNASPNVWRKHKNFILNKQLAIPNTSIFANSNVDFNWSTATPTTGSWKKTSEITRYNHYSMPIETKDLNNNFASSKMADNQTKVIASGNARYTEMYYSGAEYIESGNYFEGEVQGANYVTDEVAHTGNYSVKVDSENTNVFEVNGSSGATNYYENPDTYTAPFRPGRYKVSVWALENDNTIYRTVSGTDNGTALIYNDQEIDVSEVVESGCWKQYNYYIDIPANTSNTIYFKNTKATSSNIIYYDDFRLHPVGSNINSFVYDHQTDELSYMLDSNNMGSHFKYDNAGRLLASYVETENHENLYGGFKISAQYKQKYKNANDVSVDFPSTLNNCLTSGYKEMGIQLENDFMATFENRFKTSVIGGSGVFSYQYRWLINAENKEFSNWTTGNSLQSIPYAMNSCQNASFDKNWSFIVKVTDLVTNKAIEKEYSSSTKDCQFNSKKWGDIQVSKINNICGEGNYNFKIHLKDNSKQGNFIYEYAYYNPSLTFSQQNFINVTSANGNFCPNWSMIEDLNCKYGYRDYINIAYRVTNTTTGEVSNNIIMFMGDETPNGIFYPIQSLNDVGRKYLGEGVLLQLTEKNELFDVINVNKIVR